MGDDRTRPEDETQTAQGTDRAAAPDEHAAGIAATAHPEASSGRMQAGAAVRRLEVRLPRRKPKRRTRRSPSGRCRPCSRAPRCDASAS